MIKQIINKLKESAISVLPIYLLILIINFTPLVSLTGYEITIISFSTIILIVGMALFNLGADIAMTPMGKAVGVGITKQGKLVVLLAVVFVLGFLITIAEPDLTVLANQTKEVINSTLLTMSIGIGVGIFLVFATLKVIFKLDVGRLLSYFYMLLFAIVIVVILSGNEAILALAFDSGGVTTGPITVPFLMAIGVGVSSLLSKKSDKDASFGFIALASIGPIIVVLLLSVFAKSDIDYKLPDYSIASNFASSFAKAFLHSLYEVGLPLLMISLFFLVCNFFVLHLNLARLKKLGIGLLYAYLGLVLFLSAVSVSYMPIGFKIGSSIASYSKIWLVIFGFLIGALTVLAEPAIHVLNNQVEEITQGLVKKKSMLIALTIGVGVAILLSMIRIIFNFSILYYLIPGYLLCLGLTLFVPKIYSAIAFDSGGVASGPLTSSFILPLSIGACVTLGGEASVLQNGFGIVAMVAMTPLIAIETIGLVAIIKDKRKVKKATKRIVKENDDIIFEFLGGKENGR